MNFCPLILRAGDRAVEWICASMGRLAVPTGLGPLTNAYPALKGWAKLFLLATRDWCFALTSTEASGAARHLATKRRTADLSTVRPPDPRDADRKIEADDSLRMTKMGMKCAAG